MKLYNIPAEMARLEDLLIDAEGELTPELEAEFDRIMRESKEKLEGAAAVIRRLELDAKMAKEEAQRLARRAQAHEKSAERLKALVLGVVDSTYEGKMKTARFTVWGQNAADTAEVELAPDVDLTEAAKIYPHLVKTEYSIRRGVLQDMAKRNDEIPPEFVVTPKKGTRYLRIL